MWYFHHGRSKHRGDNEDGDNLVWNFLAMIVLIKGETDLVFPFTGEKLDFINFLSTVEESRNFDPWTMVERDLLPKLAGNKLRRNYPAIN